MKPEVKHLLEKQHYEIVGKNSAVKICTWTKKSLRDEDFCYKQKFYGIKSHLCCQIAPSVNFCQQSCIFCWRPIEHTEGIEMKEYDNPKDIIKGVIEGQRKLLSGFGGNEKVNKKKFEEAQTPTQFAISLAGEPTLYPRLDELVKELNRIGTTFVVSNGLSPEVIKKIKPTQLYISLDAPNEEIYKKVCRPSIKDGWKKLMESLSLLENKKRSTIRITLVKGLNMVHPEKYGELVKKASPKFVEIKAYMNVGYSKQRLDIKTMPLHSEIKEFAKKVAKESGYKIIDEKKESRVVLLMKEDKDRLIH
jgi:tRNA wybutosine-synthesizing protein 1